MATYDNIGRGYNRTRRADPYLLGRMEHYLASAPGICLDIGCGSGNYTSALHKRGLKMLGVDPSAHMLALAQKQHPHITWLVGQSDLIPLDDEACFACLASLTIHHWEDIALGFGEIFRVLKPGSRILIFTSSPEQMQGYWLRYYFPRMMQDAIAQMPDLKTIQAAMLSQGLIVQDLEAYHVHKDLQDHFLYVGKHRPSLYLQEEVRAGISSFSALAHASEVEEGLSQLEKDITSGRIHKIMEDFENDQGDYLFVVGEKPGT